MTRLSPFNSPLLLGFDHLEQILERVSKTSNDGYPPYNILQTGNRRLRISLAVAGFTEAELSLTLEQNQLHIHGRQQDDPNAVYLHHGIAARGRGSRAPHTNRMRARHAPTPSHLARRAENPYSSNTTSNGRLEHFKG